MSRSDKSRAGLLRFLASWTASGGGCEILVGRPRLSAELLSDDALDGLASSPTPGPTAAGLG